MKGTSESAHIPNAAGSHQAVQALPVRISVPLVFQGLPGALSRSRGAGLPA
jgi:hypothetical protein